MKSKRSKFQDEFMAAAIGDLEWLKQSLRENSTYTSFDENGLSALHLASIHGRFECLKYLIEDLKVDVNLVSLHGWMPIHLCINSKIGGRALEIMLYLMHQGALLSSPNEDGLTPVHQAASEGHFRCLSQLIDAGADFSSLDNRKNRPIDLAKLWGHKECAKLLATHSWHKGKAILANERYLLKKWEIRQILIKLEKNLAISEEHSYRGTQAFTKWLNDSIKVATKEVPSKLPMIEDNKEVKKTKEIPSSPPRKVKQADKMSQPLPWNAVTRPIETFTPYPGSLRDLYPRHPYTLEPYSWSSPEELNPKCKEPLAQLLAQQDPDLVRKVAKERGSGKTKAPSKVSTAQTSTRNMYYKSDSVMNIPSKNMPQSAALLKTTDSVFCFTNDIDSALFRSGLNFALMDDGSTCPSTASTDISQFMNDSQGQRCRSVDIMSLEN